MHAGILVSKTCALYDKYIMATVALGQSIKTLCLCSNNDLELIVAYPNDLY